MKKWGLASARPADETDADAPLRPSMGAVAVALLLGATAAAQFSALPDPRWGLLLPVVAVAAWRWAALRLPAVALAGLAWALAHGHMALSQALPEALERRDLEVVGTVASLPQQRPRGVRFEMEIETLRHNGRPAPTPGRVRLAWYQALPSMPAPGQRWRLVVRLKRAHGFFNPGGFDYEGWLFHRGIRATGYVRADPLNRLLDARPAGRFVDRLRLALRERMARALGEQPFAGLLIALAVGDRQGIATAQWETLRRSGSVHLMAISGLHIGLIAMLAFFATRRLWRRSATLVERLAAPRAAALAAVVAAALYAALAGFSIPTQRALVMTATAMVALFARRGARPADLLALALIAVLAIDPLAPLAVGFWLSFVAVATLIYGAAGRIGSIGRRGRAGDMGRIERIQTWGARLTRAQWALAVGMLPAMALLLHQTSLTAPLANLFAVPWVGLLVVPTTLLGALLTPLLPAAGGLLLDAAHGLFAALWPLLEALAAPSFALWRFAQPPLWTLPLAALGATLLLLPRGLPGRWLGLLWFAPLLFATPPRPAEGEAWIAFLDVGQGSATVIETRRHLLVYDAGPRFSANFDAGRAALLPFLRARGWRAIDDLVISHIDRDHSGGLDSLRRGMPIRRLWSARPERFARFAQLPSSATELPITPCRAGRAWRRDGVALRFLHPAEAALKRPELRGRRGANNASCVLRVETAGGALLLTGDIERAVEERLAADDPAALRAEILAAPHHGSATSSTPAFLDAAAPRVAIFSTGYRNRFGFPRPETAARYRARGVKLHNTATEGAILIKLGGEKGLDAPDAITSWRRQRGRYWNAAAAPQDFSLRSK